MHNVFKLRKVLIMLCYHILHNPPLHSQGTRSHRIVPCIEFWLSLYLAIIFSKVRLAYLAFGFGPGSGLAMEMGMNSKRQMVVPMVILLVTILTKLALKASNFPHPPFLDKGNEN